MDNTYEGTYKPKTQVPILPKILAILFALLNICLMMGFWVKFFEITKTNSFFTTLGNILGFKTGVGTSLEYIAMIAVSLISFTTIVFAIFSNNGKAINGLNLTQNILALALFIVLVADTYFKFSDCASNISNTLRFLGLASATLGLCGYRFGVRSLKRYERVAPVIVKCALIVISVCICIGLFYPVNLSGQSCYDYILAIFNLRRVVGLTTFNGIVYIAYALSALIGLAYTIFSINSYGRIIDFIKSTILLALAILCNILLLTSSVGVAQLGKYTGSVLLLIGSMIAFGIALFSLIQGNKLGENVAVLTVSSGMEPQDFKFVQGEPELEFTIETEEAPVRGVAEEVIHESFKPSDYAKPEEDKVEAKTEEKITSQQTIKSNIVEGKIPKIKPEAMHNPTTETGIAVQGSGVPMPTGANMPTQAGGVPAPLATHDIASSDMGMMQPAGTNMLEPTGGSGVPMVAGGVPMVPGGMPMVPGGLPAMPTSLSVDGIMGSESYYGNNPPFAGGMEQMAIGGATAPIPPAPFSAGLPSTNAGVPSTTISGVPDIGSNDMGMMQPSNLFMEAPETSGVPMAPGGAPNTTVTGLVPFAPTGMAPFEGGKPIMGENGGFYDPFAEMPLFDESTGMPLMGGGLLSGGGQVMLEGAVDKNAPPINPQPQTQQFGFKQIFPDVEQIDDDTQFSQGGPTPPPFEQTYTNQKNPYANYEAAFDSDNFLNSLNKKEREEFDKLFVKNAMKQSNVPTYVVGGENKDFFSKVFMYLGRNRSSVTDELFDKIYDFASKLNEN